MTHLARLALATSEMGSRPSLAALAWIAGLTDRGLRVQHFRARACPTGAEVVRCLSGLPGRHLDSWLMPEDVVRTLFHRGASLADASIVEGSYNTNSSSDCLLSHPSGGLRPIVEVLELPVVAVISAPDLDNFHMPEIPKEADAIFLENLNRPEDFVRLREVFGFMTKKPVVGALERLPEIQQLIIDGPRDPLQNNRIFKALSDGFAKYIDLIAVKALLPTRAPSWTPTQIKASPAKPFVVAYAQDCAFGEYFPDTLEALEAMGAELVEFSPVHNEHLPKNADLVMIGCGFPDHHLTKIVNNLSLIGELRQYVCSGRRIYAEGGGAAYLGRSMVVRGCRVSGAGILPFDAHLIDNPSPPRPVVRTLDVDTWLGPAGTEVRGYLSGRWQFVPESSATKCRGTPGALTSEADTYYRHHAVGGLIHLHLGALPHVVAAFAGEHSASLSLPSSRPNS